MRPRLLHIQVHHLPGPCRADALRGSAQLLTCRGQVAQSGDPESVQPPAHGAQMQLMAFGAQMVMDAPGWPLAFPPQLFDPDDEPRIELAGGRVRTTGAVLQPRPAFGAIAGHPGRDGRARDTELGGHVSDRDAVVQVAFDHAQTPGRGQWCISAGHERALSFRGWVV